MSESYEFDGRTFDALNCIFHSSNQDEENRAYCPHYECGWSERFADLPTDESGYYISPPWCPRGGPAHGLVQIERDQIGTEV
jgi:hypothetical protein